MPLRVLPDEPPRTGTCVFARRYPSRLDWKPAILDAIADEVGGRGWVLGEDLHWLHLCLDEVIVNAMLHGNEGDPELEIEVALYDDGDRWTLLIIDQGDGFELGNLPDLDDPETLLLEHGRGIRIMREWLDDLTYYRNGACALLSRRCGESARDPDAEPPGPMHAL